MGSKKRNTVPGSGQIYGHLSKPRCHVFACHEVGKMRYAFAVPGNTALQAKLGGLR